MAAPPEHREWSPADHRHGCRSKVWPSPEPLASSSPPPGAPWWLIPALFLVRDLSWLGYLARPCSAGRSDPQLRRQRARRMWRHRSTRGVGTPTSRLLANEVGTLLGNGLSEGGRRGQLARLAERSACCAPDPEKGHRRGGPC